MIPTFRTRSSGVNAIRSSACSKICTFAAESRFVKQINIVGCRLRVAGYGLQVSGYGLQVTGCRLQVAGYKLQVFKYWMRLAIWRDALLTSSVIVFNSDSEIYF